MNKPLLHQKCHHGSRELVLSMVNKEAGVKEDCISLVVHKAEVEIEVEGITKEEDITKVEDIEVAIINKVNTNG